LIRPLSKRIKEWPVNLWLEDTAMDLLELPLREKLEVSQANYRRDGNPICPG